MSTEGENKVNEFEQEWLQGEAQAPEQDKESAATIEAARADTQQAADEYLQAHADLESEQK